MQKKSLLSILLSLTLFSSSIAPLWPTVAFAAPGIEDTPANGSSGSNDPVPPEMKEIVAATEGLEQGRFDGIRPTDPFGLVGDVVEVYNGSATPLYSFDPTQPRPTADNLIFTKMKAVYDASKHQLIFEATRGENDNGEHGVLVARQIKAGHWDIAAMAQDAEMLVVLTNQGELYAFDWGFLVEHAFEVAMPKFKLWQSPTPVDYTGQRLTASFLNRGVKPYDVVEASDDDGLQRDASGEPRFNSRDISVGTVGADGAVHHLRTFPGAITHKIIALRTRMLQILIAVAANDLEEIRKLEPMVQEAIAQYPNFEAEVKALDQASMSPSVAVALRSFDRHQVEGLNQRIADHNDLSERNVDWFTLREWFASFSQLETLAQKQGVDQDQLPRQWKAVLEGTAKKAAEKSDGPSLREQPVQWARKAAKGFLSGVSANKLKILGGMFGILAWDYPSIYQHNEAMQQVYLLSFLYENFYQRFLPVLCDASYRLNPLAISTLALVSLWPILEGIGLLTNRTIRYLNSSLQNSSSPFARKVRDISKNWADLDRWQTLLALGSRGFAKTFYPLWKSSVEIILRQPAFYPALERRLKAFRVVQPDSAVGQQAGIERPEMLGIMNPFLFGNARREAIVRKALLQESAAAQNKAATFLAWLLASVVVAEKSKIDLATLLMAESGDRVEKLRALATDPDTVEEWGFLAYHINSELLNLQGQTNIDFTKVNFAKVQEFYVLAKATVNKIARMDYRTATLSKRKKAFDEQSIAMRNRLINLGVPEYNFLNRIYPDHNVTSQTRDQFVPDHITVAVQMAIFGSRANPADPQNLAASRTGILWTSPPHLADVGFNAYSYFFSLGAQLSLQYQKLKAKSEDIYDPWEQVALKPKAAAQPMLPALWQWFKVFWPSRFSQYDVGGAIVRRQMIEISTIQSYYLSNVPMRMIFAGQSFGNALAGSEYVWATAMWYYRAIWSFINQGNTVYSRHFAGLMEQYQDAQRLLSWGLRETNPDLAQQYLAEGTAKMHAFYEKGVAAVAAQIRDENGNFIPPEQLLSLSVSQPPIALLPNSNLQTVIMFLGAFSTTALATRMSVASYDPNRLNFETLLLYNGMAFAAYGPAYLGLSARWRQLPQMIASAGKKAQEVTHQCIALLRNERPDGERWYWQDEPTPIAAPASAPGAATEVPADTKPKWDWQSEGGDEPLPPPDVN